jgi:hypothetical protein
MRRWNPGDIYYIEEEPDPRWWKRLLAVVTFRRSPTLWRITTVIAADHRTGAVLFH